VHIVRNRWFNVGPGLTNKKKSRAKPKNKRATDIPVVGVETEVDSDETEEAGPSRKKIRKSVESDEDDDGESHDITVYVSVSSSAPPLSCVANKPVKAPPPKITARPPFTSNSKNDYKTFLSLIAKTVMCPVDSLDYASMQWKFDRPANAKSKPLMSEMCYNAMVSTVIGRKKDFVVTISMQPPRKHVDNVVSPSFLIETLIHLDLQPWPIEDDGNDGQLPVDYEHSIDELMQGQATVSIRDQMVCYLV
jgi:hypothetical protein